MKKIILLISILIMTSACSNLNKLDYKENINNTIRVNSKNKFYNHVGNGYKYYLPKYMSVKNRFYYNEKINCDDYTYYLYLDIVSYYNKKTLNFKENANSYINFRFEYNGIQGFLRVTEENDKYLVEIIYNYAKIEVKVDKIHLESAINNSIIILSTIRYDDDLIGNLIGENKINSSEETLSIFDTTVKDNFLDIIEEYDNYEEEESDIPDFDVIN